MFLKDIWRKLLIFFCVFLYLYVGYHLRDSIFDVKTFQFIDHPGIDGNDYASSFSGFWEVIAQPRWISNIVTVPFQILMVSVSIALIFRNRSFFVITLLVYAFLISVSVLFILLFSMIGKSMEGYSIARAIKDNTLYTPLVFVFLVALFSVIKKKSHVKV